jgi:hypothetical protein
MNEMKSKGSPLIWITLLFVITTMVSGSAAVYYYYQSQTYMGEYQRLSSDLNGLTMKVSLKIDYGNGTVTWFNATRVPLNSTLLTTTKMLTRTLSSASSLGVFVSEINGLTGDSSHYWGWSYFDTSSWQWEYGQVGADQWPLHDGDIVSWTYSSF